MNTITINLDDNQTITIELSDKEIAQLEGKDWVKSVQDIHKTLFQFFMTSNDAQLKSVVEASAGNLLK